MVKQFLRLLFADKQIVSLMAGLAIGVFFGALGLTVLGLEHTMTVTLTVSVMAGCVFGSGVVALAISLAHSYAHSDLP